MVLCKCSLEIILTSLYLVEGLALTKCCPSVLDTVGWVIWPLKIVRDMTYNVFGDQTHYRSYRGRFLIGGTLNRTLLLVGYGACRWYGSSWSICIPSLKFVDFPFLNILCIYCVSINRHGRKVAYTSGNNVHQFQGQRSKITVSRQINARVGAATWLRWNRSTDVTAVGGIPCPAVRDTACLISIISDIRTHTGVYWKVAKKLLFSIHFR